MKTKNGNSRAVLLVVYHKLHGERQALIDSAWRTEANPPKSTETLESDVMGLAWDLSYTDDELKELGLSLCPPR